MLTIEKVVLPSPEQWEIIMEGMRNPKNSWAKSDSYTTHIQDPETLETADYEWFMGDNDHDLAMRLANGGSVHAKYRRMIPVWATINAPLYWWKEFDTYKVGTVANSCSTMHKIHAKEFVRDDFSTEYLEDVWLNDFYCLEWSLNRAREKFLETGKKLKRTDLTDAERKHTVAQQKRYWWQMIQLLPSSYNQKRTVFLSYEVLANMYKWRRNHKLDEWHTLCDWIETLPYAELIVG